jgi:hypothetical protein
MREDAPTAASMRENLGHSEFSPLGGTHCCAPRLQRRIRHDVPVGIKTLDGAEDAKESKVYGRTVRQTHIWQSTPALACQVRLLATHELAVAQRRRPLANLRARLIQAFAE